MLGNILGTLCEYLRGTAQLPYLILVGIDCPASCICTPSVYGKKARGENHREMQVIAAFQNSTLASRTPGLVQR